MNTLKQFNDAMAYIEGNLLNDIDTAKIARTAGCSEYHFRRMFSFLAGMPLGEYIRRRKLSLAATLLKAEGQKVVDVALALDYETPEAFSKAFLAMHGITPSRVKKESVELKAFAPMTFQLTISGGIEMDYRIVEKDDFKIVGFKKRITMQFHGVNPQMKELTDKLTPDIILELKGMSNVEPNGILSVSANFSQRIAQGSELDQYIGAATTMSVPDGYDALHVEASTWAVFSTVGAFPNAAQETWAKIYAEWFPSSGYELTGGPEILWNESPDTSKPDYKSEIWVPVHMIRAEKRDE